MSEWKSDLPMTMVTNWLLFSQNGNHDTGSAAGLLLPVDLGTVNDDIIVPQEEGQHSFLNLNHPKS